MEIAGFKGLQEGNGGRLRSTVALMGWPCALSMLLLAFSDPCVRKLNARPPFGFEFKLPKYHILPGIFGGNPTYTISPNPPGDPVK